MLPAADGRIGFCAVAMMQKDEGDVLRAWIDHYASLFVPHALTIFDNGSTGRETLDQLRRAEKLGIRVDRSHARTADFLSKGAVLLAHFASLGGRHEFLYPCDCDELLVCGDPADDTASLDASLRTEFEALRHRPASIFRISAEYRNAPGQALFSSGPCFKVLFKDPPPPMLDRGLHLYDFPHHRDAVPGIAPCAFAQVHFHYKPFDLTLRSARQKLKTHTATFDRKLMRVYAGPGEHLRPLFNMTTERYRERTSEGATIDLSAWFERRGVVPPYAGPSALRANDDERVVFERRPLNPAVFYESSGLGEATIDLLEPLLWRAKAYLEYTGQGTGAELARAAGVTEIRTIRARRWRFGQHPPTAAPEIDERPVPPLKLRSTIERYCAVPPSCREAEAILVGAPHRFAVLCTLYAEMSGSFRVCVPRFAGWRRAADAAELFDVTCTLDGVAVLAPRPGRQALARTLFTRYWRDAT